MTNLQIFKNEQVIPINENETGEVIVSGRDLYEFLEIESKYQDWINRMFEYGFTENTDYISLIEPTQKKEGSRMVTRDLENHILKLDMAKEISMIQRNEKGKQARQYFIQVEKAWNSPEMIMKRALDIASKSIENLKLESAEKDKKLVLLESSNNYKDGIIIGLVDEITLAEKRQILTRVVRHRGADYQKRWRELYKQFEMKYHINLQHRLDKYNVEHKPKLRNKVDYIDKAMNKIPELYEVAVKLYENDVKELAAQLYEIA